MRLSPAVGVVVAASLVACGADGTIDLLPTANGGGGAGVAGGPSGSGGVAGSGGGGVAGGCTANAHCDPPTPMCDKATGACVACPVGMVTCGSECVDTTSDAAHCGQCDMGCSHLQFCLDSHCHCLPGTTLCADNSCHDLASDPDHCGGCLHPCATGEKCEASACSVGTCSAGLTSCPATDNRVACVDLAVGYPKCGSCDVVCGPTQTCVSGACRDYEPATPCNACPCDDVCTASLGDPATCCDGLYGGTHPVCVQGSACP